MTTNIIRIADIAKEPTVIQVNDDTYVGKAKDIVSMLIEFAVAECTDCFYENEGIENLDRYHLDLAQGYLEEAKEIMRWLDYNNCSAERIVKAYTGPIDALHLEVEQCD